MASPEWWETTNLIIGTAGALAGGAAGAFSALTLRDALRSSRERRADRAQRALGVRYEHALNTGLEYLDQAERIACLAFGRHELLTTERMDALGLKKIADDIAIHSGSLPKAVQELMCRCHRGIAWHADALLNTPFPDEPPTPDHIDLRVPPPAPLIVAGAAAIDQYAVAGDFYEAIQVARERLRDYLPI